MILIIGAGLSGLLTAYRLQKEGIPYKILEARSRIGGRIHTLTTANHTPVEMGATWFTDVHNHLRSLLNELAISYFEQYSKGSAFYQSTAAFAQEIQLPNQPSSYRISGGSSNLIETLYSKLNPNNVLLNQTVKEIKATSDGVLVVTDQVYEGTHAVLAIPPKLWSKNIVFEPPLPQSLTNVALQTHTWMEDSIKVAVTYAAAFWQQENQSGMLFSTTGPLTEFYDHCDHARSTFALCGFCSTTFKNLSYEERKTKVIHQLKNAFGEKATQFLDYNECIWSQEPNTFHLSDSLLFPHQNNGHPIFSKTYYNDTLFISSAEASAAFPGYMDGAVFVGNAIAKKLILAHQ